MTELLLVISLFKLDCSVEHCLPTIRRIECHRVRSLLVKNMKSHSSCYIIVFAVIKCARVTVWAFKLVREAKHCIRQSVLQAGLNAILYSYIASLLLSMRLECEKDVCCSKVLIYWWLLTHICFKLISFLKLLLISTTSVCPLSVDKQACDLPVITVVRCAVIQVISTVSSQQHRMFFSIPRHCLPQQQVVVPV